MTMQNPSSDGFGTTYGIILGNGSGDGGAALSSPTPSPSSSAATRMAYTTTTSDFNNTSSTEVVDFNNTTMNQSPSFGTAEFGNTTSSSLDVDIDDLLVDNTVEYVPNNQFVLMVIGMAALFFFIVVLIVMLRDYLWRKYGIDICCGNGPKAHNANASSAAPWSLDYYGVHNYYTDMNTMRVRRAALLEELQNLESGAGGLSSSTAQNEHDREEAIAKRREARKIWYEEYLKPYTMVVEEKDMVYATIETSATSATNAIPPDGALEDDEEHDIELGDVDAISSNEDSERTDRTIDTYTWNEGSNRATESSNHEEEEELSKIEVSATTTEAATTAASARAEVCSCKDSTNNDGDDGEDHSDDDIESQNHEDKVDTSATALSSPPPVNSDEEKAELDDSANAGDNPVCCLRVPIRNKDDDSEDDKSEMEKEEKTHRCVDICCSICIGEYEVGDHVVFSSQKECQHAFHEECIMQWLCKGKKRCPICRNWFVPGISIAEQKEAAAAIALVEEAMHHDNDDNEEDEADNSDQRPQNASDDVELGVTTTTTTDTTADTPTNATVGIVIAEA